MEKKATDTYSFSDIREGGFAYVDKTTILTLAGGSIFFPFALSSLSNIKAVLVETLCSGNVGSACRAMANMIG